MPASQLQTVPSSAASPAADPFGIRSSVLLATDGTPQSDGAASVCAALARDRDVALHVLSVVEPMALEAPRYREEVLEDERCAKRLEVVRSQVERVGLDPEAVPILLEQGAAIPIIMREARAIGAELLVFGHAPRSPSAGVFRQETTLRVMRRTRVPILVAVPWIQSLPERIVVAVDFGTASIRAAHTAARVLADAGTLLLTHVVLGAGGTRPHKGILEHAERKLQRMSDLLALPAGARVEYHVMRGSPYTEAKGLVERMGADLVALGTSRHPAAEHVTVGRTATAFTRFGEVSLLAAPRCDAWDAGDAGDAGDAERANVP